MPIPPVMPLNFRGDGVNIRSTTIERQDNHIYFYADVESDNCLKLLKLIREADAELRNQHHDRWLGDAPLMPVWVHINSYGGDLFAGFSMADQFPMIKSPIYTLVEGICASAATLIAMSATKRFILPNSFMLIHQLSTMVWGTHEQFKDEMELQKKAMEKLVAFYASHSKVTEKQIRRMLTRDFWVDAETCIEKGFVDEVFGVQPRIDAV